MTDPVANRVDLPPGHLKSLLFYLKAFVPQATVWIFGSRINGQAQELSDIDLVLINKRSPDQPVEGIDRLRQALQESTLPYLVDLTDWCNMEEGFRNHVQAKHRVLQEGA